MKPPRACPTGKIVYSTKAEASAALVRMHAGESDTARRRERRAYRCPVCWQFHTTSKPRRAGKHPSERAA